MLLLPYARAIIPARLRGFLASIGPFPAARELKYHTDLVEREYRRILRSRQQAVAQDGFGPRGVPSGSRSIGKDLLTTLCKPHRLMWSTRLGSHLTINKWKPT